MQTLFACYRDGVVIFLNLGSFQLPYWLMDSTTFNFHNAYIFVKLTHDNTQGKSSLCEDSQDSHPVSESTPTFSSAMGFDSTFTSSARIQDSHPVKESVKYSRQPWESGRFPSPMGI